MAAKTYLAVTLATVWMMAFAPVVKATTVSEMIASIPKCALPCVIDSLQVASCSMTNITLLSDCVCQNTTLLSSLSECTQTSCAFSDQVLASTAENSLCAAYPKESRTNEVQIVAIVTLALSLPIILARCAARLQTTKKLWIDDWTALLGMIPLAGLAVIEYISARIGFGMHYWNVAVSDGTLLLQLFYVAQLLYIFVQIALKVSIACLFIRVFPDRRIRLALKIFIGFMVGHGLIFMFVILFQCWPIYSIWDRTITGKCVDVTAVGLVGGGISIAEDIFLILLPISELRKLQVTVRQRVVLFFMFTVASFAVVTSMIRLKYLVMFANTFDSTWDNVDVIIWSLIELLTAALLGSVPPLRPWISKVVPRISVTWSKPATGNSRGHTNQSAENEQKSKQVRSDSLAISARSPPRYSSHTKNTSSFAMSAISSMRSSDYWKVIPESPLHVPTSRFQDSAVALPSPTHQRWSQQPDSPTDPNILVKCMSLYLTKVASSDLESNRDTWTTQNTRDTWTANAVERLSSKYRDSARQAYV